MGKASGWNGVHPDGPGLEGWRHNGINLQFQVSRVEGGTVRPTHVSLSGSDFCPTVNNHPG